MSKRWLLLVLMGAFAPMAACTGDDGGGGGDGDGMADAAATTPDAAPVAADAAPPDASPCATAGAVCGQLLVPADFTGTPRLLRIGLYSSLPPAGPPQSTLLDTDLTSVTPGEPLDVVVTDFPDTGTYHAYVVLYVEGGGTFVPASGKDYVGQSEAMLFGGESPVDLGQVTLSLAP